MAEFDEEAQKAFWDGEASSRGDGAGTVGYLAGDWPAALAKHRLAQEIRWVTERVLPSVAPGSCLDVGCGGGSWLKVFASRFEKVLGLDFSAPMARAAAAFLAKEGLANASARQGSILDLSGTGSHDFVFVGGVLTCLDDGQAEQAVSQVAGALNPGGVALFRESIHRGATFYREAPLARGLFSDPNGPRPPYRAVYRSHEHMAQLISGAGLELIRAERNHAYSLSDMSEEFLRLWNACAFGRLAKDRARAERAADALHRYRHLSLVPAYQVSRLLPPPFRKRRNVWFVCKRA